MSDLERLVARLNASAFFTKDEVDPHKVTSKRAPKQRTPKQRTPKQHKLVRDATALSGIELDVLIALLDGRRAVLTVGGVSYAVRASTGGWDICSVSDPDQHKYFVDAAFSSCTCPNSRFRGEVCKHIVALQGVLT